MSDIKICHKCGNTKLVGRCDRCGVVKGEKPTAKDLSVDWPEVVDRRKE